MNIGFVKSAVEQPQQPPAARAARAASVNIGFGEHKVCEHRVCEHRDPRCEHRVCEPFNLWILDVNIGFVKSAVDQPQQPQQPHAARAARAASAIGVFKYCQSVVFA